MINFAFIHNDPGFVPETRRWAVERGRQLVAAELGDGFDDEVKACSRSCLSGGQLPTGRVDRKALFIDGGERLVWIAEPEIGELDENHHWVVVVHECDIDVGRSGPRLLPEAGSKVDETRGRPVAFVEICVVERPDGADPRTGARRSTPRGRPHSA